MPTVGVVNGKFLRVKVADVNVAKSTSCKFSMKNKARQTATKDDAGAWEGNEYGEFSGSCSTDMLVAEGTNGLKDLTTSFLAKTKVAITFGSGTTGDMKYTVQAIIEDISVDAANNENSTASVSFLFDGAVTLGTFA